MGLAFNSDRHEAQLGKPSREVTFRTADIEKGLICSGNTFS